MSSTEAEDRADEAYDAWADLDPNMSVHRVEWTLEKGSLYGKVVCDGDEKSGCRAYCPDQCEVSPCGHMPKFGKHCGIEPWFEDPIAEYYVGEPTLPRNGPIKLIWDGDDYGWQYADAPVDAAVASSRGDR